MFLKVCKESPLFQEKIGQFKLPDDFEIVIEPWPYVSLELDLRFLRTDLT